MPAARIRRALIVLALVAALFAGPGARPLAAQQERPVAEELILGISRTVQQTAAAAIPKTVGIQIHVGEKSGYGSGAIISADGYILTCAHVIEPGQRHTVVLSNGKKYPVRVLGSNSKNDYTLIKIEAEQPLPFFRLGRSKKLRVRDWVVALGHPGGPYSDQQPAVAVGRVRGLDRKLPVGLMQKFYDQAILHDCPIFAGNSGGPLINLEGELVGINGAILLVNKNAYAAPIDEIKAELERMKRGEQIAGRGPSNMFEQMRYMQEMQKELEPGDLEKLYGKSPLMRMFRQFMGGGQAAPRPKVKVSVGARLVPADGALVFREIDPRGTAGLAGVKDGDELVAIDSLRVATPQELRRALLPLKEGQATIIVVRRGGEELRKVATFAVKSPDRQPMLRWALNRLGRRAALSTVAIRGGQEAGYGTVIGERHILTCDHILGESTRAVDVELVDGTTLRARIAGRDGQLDIALLEADLAGKRCRPARLGDSGKLRPGAWLISGGSPRGPLLAGAVSALSRKVLEPRRAPAMGLFGMFGTPNESPLRPYPTIFQHDTPLVRGLFGSGVYDTDGALVGVNVALFHRGSAYAVPAAAIRERLAALKGGRLVAQPPLWQAPKQGGGLGDLLERFFGGGRRQPEPRPAPVRGQGFIGIRLDPQKGDGRGVYVSEVVDGHPAKAAGIQAGDLIIRVGGTLTPDAAKLVEAVSAMKPGTRTTVSVLRRGATHTLKLTIGRRPQ